MQLSPFLRCLDCGVCVAIRLVRFGYNPSTGRIALRVAPISPFPLAREPTVTAGGGQLDAIDFVTIAIPSLRSLRSRHNLRHFSYCATSPAWRLAQHNATHSRTTVKSDARYGRRLAAPIPSSKLHIPLISTLRIGFRFWRNLKTLSS